MILAKVLWAFSDFGKLFAGKRQEHNCKDLIIGVTLFSIAPIGWVLMGYQQFQKQLQLDLKRPIIFNLKDDTCEVREDSSQINKDPCVITIDTCDVEFGN
ncbi:hypothetical protein [Puia dinghuensis]|uniref:Uncharacterized protein n=1 Tax=Puia dinghuensis TaxID=1792502 RepID=A0A8J2UB68_9BACT|nr:hypothetical protein [Puia dinghuensis]GGA93072.1 hypothetical protein GCM10011511_15590 [Puia dinghuensis]